MTEPKSTANGFTPGYFLRLAERLQPFCYLYGIVYLLVAFAPLMGIRFDQTMIAGPAWLHLKIHWPAIHLFMMITFWWLATPVGAILMDPQWEDLVSQYRKTRTVPLAVVKQKLTSIVSQTPNIRGFLFLLVAIAFPTVVSMFWYSDLMLGLIVAFGVMLVPPCLALLSVLAANRLAITARRGTGAARKGLTWLQQATRYIFPYYSVHLSFICLWFFFLIGPLGVVPHVHNWIVASILDANMGVNPAHSGIRMAVLTCLLMAAGLLASSRLASNLGRYFQSCINRYYSSCMTTMESITATARESTRAVSMQQQVSWTKDFVSSILFIVLAYSILFAMIASSALDLDMIGTTLKSYIAASLAEAGLYPGLADNLKFMVFLASVIAAWLAVPLAGTACNFLPNRRRQTLQFNQEGILFDSGSLFNAIAGAPWKSWRTLRRVSIESSFGKKYLKLKFRDLYAISISLDRISSEDLITLLITADENSSVCKFEAETLSLLASLRQTNDGHGASCEFQSTIFQVCQPGDSILDGSFRIIKPLSSRPLSAVYLARNLSNKHVIVKQFVVPDDSPVSAKWRNNLEREYDLLKECSHPSVAQVIDVMSEFESTFLIVERIEGDTLRDVVERYGRRSQSRVLKWAKEIALVMIFLHGKEPPVIHRDLTPDNLIVDNEGCVKLIDFGAAHEFMEGVTGTLIGKQCYIAPEQLRGELNLKSDIYSFGGTLYYLLTGQDPEALSRSDVSDLDVSISEELNELIKACTSFDENERPRSFEEVLRLLEAIELDKLSLRQRTSLAIKRLHTSLGSDFAGGDCSDQTEGPDPVAEIISLKNKMERVAIESNSPDVPKKERA